MHFPHPCCALCERMSAATTSICQRSWPDRFHPMVGLTHDEAKQRDGYHRRDRSSQVHKGQGRRRSRFCFTHVLPSESGQEGAHKRDGYDDNRILTGRSLREPKGAVYKGTGLTGNFLDSLTQMISPNFCGVQVTEFRRVCRQHDQHTDTAKAMVVSRRASCRQPEVPTVHLTHAPPTPAVVHHHHHHHHRALYFDRPTSTFAPYGTPPSLTAELRHTDPGQPSRHRSSTALGTSP